MMLEEQKHQQMLRSETTPPPPPKSQLLSRDAEVPQRRVSPCLIYRIKLGETKLSMKYYSRSRKSGAFFLTIRVHNLNSSPWVMLLISKRTVNTGRQEFYSF